MVQALERPSKPINRPSLARAIADTGSIVDSLSKKSIRPFSGHTAVIDESEAGRKSWVIKHILYALNEGVKVLVADQFSRGSGYGDVASVLSKLGYQTECCRSPYDAQRSTADLLIVNCATQSPRSTMRSWTNLLKYLSSSHPRVLLVIPDTVKMTAQSVFEPCLSQWLSKRKAAGLQIILEERRPFPLSQRPSVFKQLDAIAISNVNPSNILEFQSLGFPGNRLYAYSHYGQREHQYFKQQWLLLSRRNCTDLIHYPSLVVQGLTNQLPLVFGKRNEFFRYFRDPFQALEQFSLALAIAHQYDLEPDELDPGAMDLLPDLIRSGF